MPYRDKDKKDKWRAQVRRKGKKRSELFDTRSEAVKWEVEQKKLPLDQYLSGISTASSLAEWATKYLDHSIKYFVTKTYKEKKMAFRNLFESIDPRTKPEALNKGILKAYFEKQAEERTGNAANKDRKNLIAAWNWAVENVPAWPEYNPVEKTPKQPSEEWPRYIPPVDDFWTVYDSLPMGQDKVMLLSYLHTAARRGELFRLLWSEIDFSRSRLTLWTRKRKGGKLESDWVPMTDELKEMLLWWKKARTFRDAKNVFVCESSVPAQQELRGKPFVERQKWMSIACERAGVEFFGIHAIRHLAASLADEAGKSLSDIQGLLRHKSANTTSKYLHKLRGIKVDFGGAFSRPTPLPAEEAVEVAVNDEPKEKGQPVCAGRPILKLIPGGRKPPKAP